MIIYLDTCCYGRHFDWPQTPKIRAEATAIDAIFKKREHGELRIIGSTAVSFEIDQITDAAKHKTIDAYYCKFITETVGPTMQTEKRADVLEAVGLGKLDAAHLAIAEATGAGFLLTVDKAFARMCTERNLSKIKVMNPFEFVNGGYLK